MYTYEDKTNVANSYALASKQSYVTIVHGVKMEVLLNSDVSTNDSERPLVSDADYAAVELFKGYPDGLLMFGTICCIIFTLIGIPGNVITILALARYKRVHNATAIFIMNLSCSDLLFCCFTPPLAASSFWNRSWVHGRLLCLLYPPVRYTLIVVSIFTILAITINRYIIVVHPRLYSKIYSKRNIIIMLAAIWFAPVVVMIPTWLGKWGRFDLDEKNGSCSIVNDKHHRSPKKFLFIMSLVLPAIFIFYCYARIYLLVRKATKKVTQRFEENAQNPSTETSTTETASITVKVTAEKSSDTSVDKDIPLRDLKNSKLEVENNVEASRETSDNTDNETLGPTRIRRNILKRSIAYLKVSLPTRKDKRLGTMIVAIMTSFCLCHFPIILTKVLGWLTPHAALNIVAHVLLYFSSCINPVIYVLMSNEYRKAYKNLFKCGNGNKLLKNNYGR